MSSQPYVQSEFGRYYDQFYKRTLVPHLAVLEPATRYREIFWEGLVSAPTLLERLRMFLRDRKSGGSQPSSGVSPAPDEVLEPLTKSMSRPEQEALDRAIRESMSEAGNLEAEAALAAALAASLADEEDEFYEEDYEEEEPELDAAPVVASARAEERAEASEPAGKKQRRDDSAAEPAAASGEADTSVRVRDAAGTVVKQKKECCVLCF